MISKFLISFFFLSVMITGCSQPESTPKSAVIIKETIALQFVLDDFFTNNIELDQHIDSIYD